MRISVGKAGIAAVGLLAVGCALPSARDVVIHGRVTDGSGSPVAGAKLYIADLKYEPTISGMPNVGEHAFVYTDGEGQYSVTFRKLHSAVSISVMDYQKHFHCSSDDSFATVASEAFAGTHEIRRDLVFCIRAANTRWRGP